MVLKVLLVGLFWEMILDYMDYIFVEYGIGFRLMWIVDEYVYEFENFVVYFCCDF